MTKPFIYTKETLIDKLREIAALGWVKNLRHGNHGGIGNTLEELLGIEENNLPIPNAAEWELKTHRLNSTSLCTLFHMEPSPRAIRFVPQIFLPQYGWAHKEEGNRYAHGEMSFRQTIHGLSRSERGFMVKLDLEGRKVSISFDATSVHEKHRNWLELVKQRTVF